jgi:hypothetical protein
VLVLLLSVLQHSLLRALVKPSLSVMLVVALVVQHSMLSACHH